MFTSKTLLKFVRLGNLTFLFVKDTFATNMNFQVTLNCKSLFYIKFN